MQDMISGLFNPELSSKLCCDICGVSAVSSGINNVPPEMRPFVYGNVRVIQPLGICGECYTVVCSACAPNRHCPKCNSPYPLLAQCPSTPPPWRNLKKRLKWRQVWNNKWGR